MNDTPSGMHLLLPGQALPGDWFHGRIPDNVEAGENTVIESSHSFRYFRARSPCGFRAGRNVTLWRTSLSVERDGIVEIGDDSYLANASLVCVERITVGCRVFIAGGVTIVDSDFHPLDPAQRVADAIALSPLGDREKRPRPAAQPVIIEDDVWIGFNATVLKGVRVGRGAMVMPGAVVSRDVPQGCTVVGSPARLQEDVP